MNKILLLHKFFYSIFIVRHTLAIFITYYGLLNFEFTNGFLKIRRRDILNNTEVSKTRRKYVLSLSVHSHISSSSPLNHNDRTLILSNRKKEKTDIFSPLYFSAPRPLSFSLSPNLENRKKKSAEDTKTSHCKRSSFKNRK